MSRFNKSCIILAVIFASAVLMPRISLSQLIDTVSSEHVVMRMPAGRESLGRDIISDIERCYIFMNRATDASLPKKIAIVVNWDLSASTYSCRELSITVGMNRPDSGANLHALLLHNVGKEIARFGLIELSKGAQREDTEFLFEGMSEILVNEFQHSSRKLEATWAISRFLDEMRMLGFSAQRSWSLFSGGKRCLRNAAPGVTFLTTFRELQGRERPVKFFQELGKSSLTKSLEKTFKASIGELEEIWLKRVREYRIADEITIEAEEPPQLVQTVYVPEAGQPGTDLQVRLFFKDLVGNLLSEGIFFRDERTHRVLQAQTASEKEADYVVVTVPIASDCPPGQYGYEITAIDESGNLRKWTGSYKVGSR
ncbi:MAG: hypothetical protein JXA73_19235 [Acidobacteria bacterium]|nr:hypothetical protein [Acidobacteriota bacterium]